MAGDSYECACCGGIFRFGDHDRADSEASRICAGVPAEDLVTVCDACFRAILAEVGDALKAGSSLQ